MRQLIKSGFDAFNLSLVAILDDCRDREVFMMFIVSATIGNLATVWFFGKGYGTLC